MNEKIFGRNAVLEAIKSGRAIDKLIVAKGTMGGSMSEILRLAKEKGLAWQERDRQHVDTLVEGGKHQGVVALVAEKEFVDLEEILSKAYAKKEDPFLILLDEITDPHNLGSILRTAEAAGVHGVVIPKRRSVGLTGVVSKASAGALEYIDVARVVNLAQTIDELKKQGIWIVGTDAAAEKNFWEQDMRGPLAIVIGSEGKGLGRLVREKCDFLVKMPMLGQVSSLNASVASGLVVYEALRQRLKG